MENLHTAQKSAFRGKGVTITFAIISFVMYLLNITYTTNYFAFDFYIDIAMLITYGIGILQYLFFLIYIIAFHGKRKAPALFSVFVILLIVGNLYSIVQNIAYVFIYNNLKNITYLIFELPILAFLIVVLVDSFKGLNKKGFIVVVCLLSIIMSFNAAIINTISLLPGFGLPSYLLIPSEYILNSILTFVWSFFRVLFFYLAIWIFGVKNNVPNKMISNEGECYGEL